MAEFEPVRAGPRGREGVVDLLEVDCARAVRVVHHARGVACFRPPFEGNLIAAWKHA